MSASLAVAGQRITAAWLNLNIPGPWQAVTLSNGWTNHGGGQATFQARKFNSVTVEVVGCLNAGTTAGGTVIGTLPSALFPASFQSASGQILSGTGAGTAFDLSIFTNGQIQISAITGATEIGFHFFISLDA